MFRQFVVALLLVVWLFPPPAGAETRSSAPHQPQPQPAASQAAPVARGGVPGTDAEAQRLGEREKQAQNLKDFEGGGRVSIGTTTLIIILLLIIILVLLL